MRYSSTLYKSESRLADSQLKSHIKKHSESENYAVGHMTFSVWLTCWLGPY